MGITETQVITTVNVQTLSPALEERCKKKGKDKENRGGIFCFLLLHNLARGHLYKLILMSYYRLLLGIVSAFPRNTNLYACTMRIWISIIALCLPFVVTCQQAGINV